MSINEETMKSILDNITYTVKLGLDKLLNDTIVSQLKNEKEKYVLDAERCKLDVKRCKLEVENYKLYVRRYKLKVKKFQLKLKKCREKMNKKNALFSDNVIIDLTRDDLEIKVEKISKPYKIENIVLKIEENNIKEENVEIVSIIPGTIENKIVQLGITNEEEEEQEEEEEEQEEEEQEEEEQEEKEEQEEEQEEEEQEEEVFEVEIAYKTYFTNSEENGVIYMKDKNDEPGNQIGYYKHGEPFFY